MTFSDDHTTPSAPFSGDETGSIFDAPDMVLQSPTTSERFVETQSGFLVVIRRLEERQALSVKRRLGTPPQHSVLLTPDESLQLSRILGDGSETFRGRRVYSPQAAQWLSSEPTLNAASEPHRYRRRSSALIRHGLRGLILPACLTLALGVAIVAMTESIRLPAEKILITAAGNPLEAKKLEPIVRQFVSNMLDFNPDSYKVSQVRAMATMTPDLVESYWQDTQFPLSRKQLSALPQDTTVMINKVTSRRLNDQLAEADAYAQLVNAKTKLGSPIHLKLMLSLDSEGQVRVAGQKDLTAGSN